MKILSFPTAGFEANYDVLVVLRQFVQAGGLVSGMDPMSSLKAAAFVTAHTQ
jgi:hypothetical protein